MKYLLYTFLMVLVFDVCSLRAQTVDGVHLDSIPSEYVLLQFSQAGVFNSRVVMDVQFGQLDKVFSAKDSRFLGRDGKVVRFNSVIDGVNYFADAGFEFVQAYAFAIGSPPRPVYHYLMRRSDRGDLERSDLTHLKSLDQ